MFYREALVVGCHVEVGLGESTSHPVSCCLVTRDGSGLAPIHKDPTEGMNPET